MLRLTLRSGKDGRFLARVIDPDGFPFVLDFGDKRIIEDAQQRLLHGFTMWRHGQLITVAPQDPEVVALMAEFYAGEGLLVALDEPTWPGRAHSADPPAPEMATPADLPADDDATELYVEPVKIADGRG